MTARKIVHCYLIMFLALGCKHINEKSSGGGTGQDLQKLVTYPAPDESGFSKDYLVRIRLIEDKKWMSSHVYKSISQIDSTVDASWITFSFEGIIEIEITKLKGTLNSVIIRPKSLHVTSEIIDNKVVFQIDNPQKLSLECNGNAHHPLYIFADPLEQNPPIKSDINLVYFESGVHNIGDKYRLQSNTTYYLAGGAYLKGSFYGEGATENVSICGRGVLSSRYQNWVHPRDSTKSSIKFDDGRNIHIEGITIIESGNFQVWVNVKEENTTNRYENLKLIGWNRNTDGIHQSGFNTQNDAIVGMANHSKIVVKDCFIRANDDAILLCDDATIAEVENCVFWDDGYGATFCLSWGSINDVEKIVVKDCYVIHKYGNNPVFRARHAGESHIKNVLFDNIIVEGNINALVGLEISDHRYDKDPGHGNISDITFRNITVDGTCDRNWIKGYNQEHSISDIKFENLIINSNKIMNAEAAKFELNSFVGDVNFK